MKEAGMAWHGRHSKRIWFLKRPPSGRACVRRWRAKVRMERKRDKQKKERMTEIRFDNTSSFGRQWFVKRLPPPLHNASWLEDSRYRVGGGRRRERR
ncbi:hypothetical protein M408DRAFT_111326 [Serendipita vermifera MAFF 305830]|uniref:Uncharacterized protein n=1 Tax=Serendipita vermifera MAFF 305830 TaxID=933852 RepID=A0A0C2WUQ1_SERVB|nr:hypothetical protein M408DRAFT_111326 [Serendipita vermifera MAFF 305830]